jgi:hypothetical protein
VTGASLRRALGLASALGLAGCGAGADHAAAPGAWVAPSEGKRGVSSGSAVERYFPLVDGNLYQYVTTDEQGDQGLLVARVYRVDPQSGELRFPKRSKRFEYVADGLVVHAGPETGYVLKVPLEVGTAWRGEHGGHTVITSLDASLQVAAGRFAGCLQTVEERLGDRPVRYTTTFCPDVGVVEIDAVGGTQLEHAELKSYGPPMSIGPDGLQRVP